MPDSVPESVHKISCETESRSRVAGDKAGVVVAVVVVGSRGGGDFAGVKVAVT